MKKESSLISPSQCRAARALLDWTQPDLVGATGLSAVTIRAFEKGGQMRESNRTLLRLAFEKAGVEFIPENGGGAGVRLAKRADGTNGKH
jgi:transcriptional regulator with XRE-family HTH domain